MILSIESSCDDSSLAVTEVATKKLLFHQKISQDAEHTVYGGVVPELASRLHAVALPKILESTREFLPHLKAIAVTHEPGFHVTLMEGIMMAKALSLSLHLPLIGINHLIGHVYSLFIEQEAKLPLSVLLVSGGHTMILEVRSSTDVSIVAQTLDDSFGESFDKVAKMLNLGYPGGPIVEKRAKKGNPDSHAFPIPLRNSRELAFSFSGLKNAVRIAIEQQTAPLEKPVVANICASFQHAAVTHLLHKTRRYLEHSPYDQFAIVGGASANQSLRESMEQLCSKFGKTLLLAPLPYCSDNAAMIGRAAIDFYEARRFAPIELLHAHPRSTLFHS